MFGKRETLTTRQALHSIAVELHQLREAHAREFAVRKLQTEAVVNVASQLAALVKMVEADRAASEKAREGAENFVERSVGPLLERLLQPRDPVIESRDRDGRSIDTRAPRGELDE